MGLMGGLAGMGAAIESSAGFALRSAIEEEKALRIAENTSRLRMSEDTQIRERNKADAATERDRIRTEATGMAEKRTGIMASGAGLDDAGYRGDEGIGVNVQKGQATPTTRDFAMAKGDYTGVMADERADKTLALSREDKLSDNARLDKQFAETVRHNKAVEAHAAADRISPAAKAQLDFATASVVSAQKAEAEAAKSLEAARKGMDPAAIAQLEGEYRASKAIVQTALTQYDAVGEAHFGDKWKKIETMTPPVTGTSVDAPPAAAVEALIRGEKGADPAQFDKKYKLPAGTGAAIVENTKRPAAAAVAPRSKYLREGGGNEEIPAETLKQFFNGGLMGRGGVFGPK